MTVSGLACEGGVARTNAGLDMVRVGVLVSDGLAGAYLTTLYLGIRTIAMSPVSFIHHPELWLDIIQRYHADSCQGPAFAYELVAKRMQASGNRYDLSSIRTADCGGEPITQATLQAMLDIGIPPHARQCAFGLAECLLFVANSRNNATPSHGDEATGGISSGTLAFSRAMGYDVAVADPDTLTVVGEGETGHIYMRSPAVIPGYYRRPELSAGVFDIELQGAAPWALAPRGWYHTRDIGYVRDGELYVSGRSSDVIIVAGRNIFPQDVEKSADLRLPKVRGSARRQRLCCRACGFPLRSAPVRRPLAATSACPSFGLGAQPPSKSRPPLQFCCSKPGLVPW